jgi:GH15 family glucan-1,4-alpha-glucosidase
MSGTSYAWTRDNNVSVTGLAASGSGDISGTPNNVTGTDQTVTYTIIPTSAAGCVGNPFTATVIVRSEPTGVSTPATQTVCSDAAIATIVLSTSNSMSGTSYAWTRDNNVSVTGLAASGSGDISGTPNNVTGTDQTVTYTIIPTSAAGCVGNPFTATVIVRSEPTGVSTPATQTVCSDAAIATIVLSTSNSMSGTSYAWTRDNNVSVTGLAASGSGDISGTPNNVTGTDQTVTYTIIPTSAAGCVGNPFTATVIVRSEPTGVSTPATQTVCSDAAIATIVLSTSNSMSGTSYAWTRDNNVSVTGLAASGSGDISGTPNNVTGTDQTVTYTIIPTSAAGCVGNPFTATVIVRSEPTGVSTPATQTVCSDAAIATIVLSTSNSMSGTSYAWTRDNNVSVTGLAASGSGDISGTPNNVTGTDQTVTYTIIPTSAAGCVGNPFTATVIVRSEPTGVSTPATQTVCSDAAIATIVLSTSNSMSGTSYAWTRDNNVSVTGLAASGSGDISGTPNNVTGTDQTVTYTIIPTSAAGCVGNPFTATVIVRSEPTGVSTPATQTVCSDAAIATIVLSTSNSMSGTSYAWTRDNNVSVTGLAASGSGDISGTPNNVTGTDQTVTYTIIPTSAAGCVGNPFTATVIVRSEPTGVSTPATQTVCSDAAIATIVLSTSNSMSGTSYAWTRDNNVSVTGLAASGSGDISGTPNNVTGTDQTVTYTIIPTSAAGCVGNPFTATVIVRSEPTGVSTPATQTVCSDAAIATIVLSTSNSMSGTSYAWTRDNNVSVTGLAASGSGDISGTPNNVTGTDQTVTYTIIPTSAAGCVGNPFTATVIVRSEPTGVSTPATQTVCSDAAIATIVLSTSNSMSGTSYAWTRDNNVSVTGLAASGSGDISGTPNNVTGTDQTVTYTIIPTSAAGCVGNPFTATVIVRSEPTGVSTPATQTVCSDAAIATIVLSTSNSMSGTSYAWTRDNNVSVTGLAASGSGDISGTPNNVTGTDQTVTYTIIPTSAAGCVGNPFTATVIVRSEPTGVSTPATQTVCSDAAIATIVLSTSNSMSGTSYAWTRDNNVSVTGLAASGSGDISGTPNNVTGTDQTVTYTIIPTSAAGCVGNPFTATVIVRSEPTGVSTPATQTVCSDAAIATIVLSTSNSMSGTSYAWTRDNNVSVTGLAASGSGDISGTPNNVTGTDQTVTYTIIPTSAAGCVGNPFTATVIVRSEPTGVSTPATQTVCSDAAIATIVLSTSNSMSGTSYAWTRDNNVSVTGLAASGSGDISGTPNNVTGTDQTVTYTIILTSAAGCVGNPFTANSL